MASPLNINLFQPVKKVQVSQSMPCEQPNKLGSFFYGFRRNIIGNYQTFQSPFGEKQIIYADWTASGRAYRPIEEYLQYEIMPFIANTHTEATVTGTLMSKAYEEAKAIIKQHVHAGNDDVLLFCGSGMTAAVNKLQRIMGLRVPAPVMDYVSKEGCISNDGFSACAVKRKKLLCDYLRIDEQLKPVVFITHMEHHSNQVSWLETIATVEIINADDTGNADLAHLEYLLEQYRHRQHKIVAVTACSNVTGITTPYHAIAKLVHTYNGLCFVDFAASAPYVDINMHPAEEGTHLDAIYFSPHKFLGGPGTPGVLIFNKHISKSIVPDHPGGGTVIYTNPWKEHEYVHDTEQREDGGTPPFLQAIKAAMCIKLKEQIGVDNIAKREEEILAIVFKRFAAIKNITVLEGQVTSRLGIISFIVKGAHYNLIVKLLNDRFGIQTRGGCSCAGTYGHNLLRVSRQTSHKIKNSILTGDLSCKPGWVRLSIHPTMPDKEIRFIMDAIELTTENYKYWASDYEYIPATNNFVYKYGVANNHTIANSWFNANNWL